MSAGWVCPNNHFWRTESTDVTIDAAPPCPTCGRRGVGVDPSAATVEPGATSWAAPPVVRVPGYEIIGELGRGGMGVVYQAREERLNRTVALKMILAGGHAGDRDLARFRREVEAVAALQHPNIVQIYAVGDADGLPFCALEYVSGGTLSDVTRGGPLPPARAARLVATLARAVQAAHARDVVHRDLKPANVLLTEDGTPKITDFGLAKRLGADATATTAPGAILGTPSYMAPEQAGDKPKVIGPAADVYALGAILYQLLTARPPFTAATSFDTVLKVLHEEPAPPRRLNASVPRDLETVCLMCLRKEPGKRYASAAELADDLDRFLAGEPVRARPLGPGERLARLARRHRAAIGGAALASVVILVIIALLPKPAPPASSVNNLATSPVVAPAAPPHAANFAGLEWFVKVGRFSGPAWGTAEAGVVGTSIEFLGMVSPDSPRPEDIEVVRKPGQADERAFAARVEAVDRDLRVAKLRLGDEPPALVARKSGPLKGMPDPVKLKSATARPRDFTPAVLERVRKSAVLIRVSGPGDKPISASGWVAEKHGDTAFVITNAHVVGMQEPAKPPPDKIDIVSDSGLRTERTLAGLLTVLDREEDLAVIRVNGTELPDPLPMAPSADMLETEKMVSLAFPLGGRLQQAMNIGPRADLNPTVKARMTVLAGRIMSRDNTVKYIQMEGGIEPGGDGGALVDTNGCVNAVALGIDPGSPLGLGIPSEFVLHLLRGRVLSIQPGQAVRSGALIRQPLRASIVDPLGRLAKVTADIWPGRPGRTRRAPAAGAPQPAPGDGELVTVQLNYDPARPVALGEPFDGTAEARLAALEEGQVYWFRPHYYGKDGTERWGEAVVVEMGRYPVELKPAVLAVRHKPEIAPGEGRKVAFDSGQRLRFDISALAATSADEGVQVDFTERVRSVAATGDARARLQYTDVRLRDVNVAALPKQIRDSLASINGIRTEVTVSREGRYQSPKSDFGDTPAASRQVLQQFVDQVTRTSALLGLELPGKELQPGETWPVEITYEVATPGRDKQTAQCRIICRYVGSRVRNRREEVVIELTGLVATPMAQQGQPGRGVSGFASGAVVVDIATGQTLVGRLDSDLAVLFPYTLPNPKQPGQGMVLTVHGGVHLDTTVRRSLTGGDPKDLDPHTLLPQRILTLRPLVGPVTTP